MEKSNKMQIEVVLSEESVELLANQIAYQMDKVMEALLKPLYEEIKVIRENVDYYG